MKTSRMIFPWLALLIAALACNLQEVYELLPEPTPLPPGLHSIVVNPPRGSGQFDFTLYYRPGSYLGNFTCAYLKDPQKDAPVIIAVGQTEGLSEIAPYDGNFSETRSGVYTAYCSMGSEQVETTFTVTSPIAGTYACYPSNNCFAASFADFGSANVRSPVSLDDYRASITVDDNGLITEGSIYFEILGTPPESGCAYVRYVYAASQARGWQEQDKRFVTFVGGSDTREMSGSGDCTASQSFTDVNFSLPFIFSDQGELLLCQTHEGCLKNPVAVLRKE